MARPTLAASFTWTGSNLDDNLWSLNNNWAGNAAPASPADLVFNGVIRLVNNDDLVGLSVSSFTINANSGPFTISGNSFTLTGGITNSSTSTLAQIINDNITLAPSSGTTTTINTAGSLTLGGDISGAGVSLTKATGTGLLTLLGNNSYTGGTFINAGTLNVGSSGALGGSGTISFGGGTLQYSNFNQTDYSGRFAPNQTAIVDTNGQSVTFATAFTGTSGITRSGAGTLTLPANNTFTGVLTVNGGGTVLLTGNNSGRPAGTAGRTVVSGTLQLQANGGNTSGGVSTVLSPEASGTTNLITLNNGSTLQLRSDNSVTFAGFNNSAPGNVTIDVNNNGSEIGRASCRERV